MSEMLKDKVPAERLLSLDIYRGITMLAMMLHTFGLKELAHIPIVGVIFSQLNHAEWVGFHAEDFILPSFLFIMGFSLALSNTFRRMRGDAWAVRFRHVLKRSVQLFLFGFFLSWYSAGRPVTGPGVLQVLALSYLIGFFFCDLRLKTRFMVFVALLFIHWFFIYIVPVYDVGQNSYVIYKNIVYLIDETLTNSPSRWGYIYTVITSAAVVLFGSIVSDMYRHRSSDLKFIKALAVIGVVFIITGLAISPVNPIIKRMFTSSYTLMTSGLCAAFFVVLFYLVDVIKLRGWALPFVVVGMNSIFIYIVHNLLRSWLLNTAGIFINPLGAFIGAWIEPIKHTVSLAAQWLLCLWLYRRKIYFRL